MTFAMTAWLPANVTPGLLRLRHVSRRLDDKATLLDRIPAVVIVGLKVISTAKWLGFYATGA
jgi:hypothetical protein